MGFNVRPVRRFWGVQKPEWNLKGLGPDKGRAGSELVPGGSGRFGAGSWGMVGPVWFPARVLGLFGWFWRFWRVVPCGSGVSGVVVPEVLVPGCLPIARVEI